jgi:SEC-C motif-containing protein
MQLCPCCSKQSYDDCCGVFIRGTALPATPEQLMRSRYTAYTQANIDYIARTMRGPAVKDFNYQAAEKWAKAVNWLGLKVIRTDSKPPRGWVEFIAYYADHYANHDLHEVSEFYLDNGQWFYISKRN